MQVIPYNTDYIFNHPDFEEIKKIYKVSRKKTSSIHIDIPGVNIARPGLHPIYLKITIIPSGYIRTNCSLSRSCINQYPITSLLNLTEDEMLKKLPKVIKRRIKFIKEQKYYYEANKMEI